MSFQRRRRSSSPGPVLPNKKFKSVLEANADSQASLKGAGDRPQSQGNDSLDFTRTAKGKASPTSAFKVGIFCKPEKDALIEGKLAYTGSEELAYVVLQARNVGLSFDNSDRITSQVLTVRGASISSFRQGALRAVDLDARLVALRQAGNSPLLPQLSEQLERLKQQLDNFHKSVAALPVPASNDTMDLDSVAGESAKNSKKKVTSATTRPFTEDEKKLLRGIKKGATMTDPCSPALQMAAFAQASNSAAETVHETTTRC